MPSWPSSLPQTLQQKGYRETPPFLAMRYPCDKGGVDIVRQIATAGIRRISGTLLLKNDGIIDDVDTLDSFYETTCGGGAISFTWATQRLPITSVTMRFVSPPKYKAEGGGNIEVQLELEILP